MRKLSIGSAVIVGALCSMGASGALAADWVKFFESAGDDVSFFDRSSVTPPDQSGTRKVWIRVSLGVMKPMPNGEGAATMAKALYAVRCKTKEMSMRQVIYYNDDGRQVGGERWPNDQWTDAAPETMGESLVAVTCKTASPRK